MDNPMNGRVRRAPTAVGNGVATGALLLFLALAQPRKARAEGDDVSVKLMYYQEDDDRIQVTAPTFQYQTEVTPGLTIRIDGIYNAISGATPTGAPPVARTTAPAASTGGGTVSAAPRPSGGGGDDGDDAYDDAFWRGFSATRSAADFSAVTGATPSPTPTPAPSTPGGSARPAAAAPAASSPAGIPMAEFEDHRYAGNLEVISRTGRHTASGLFSLSTESDYLSTGLAARDAIDFNQRNTTLLLGLAYTLDSISPANDQPDDTKDSLDGMAGITQVLGPTTLLTVNGSVGRVQGYLSDPYKVVSLNGSLVPERRPDSKDKQIFLLSLGQFIRPLNGAADISYRYYSDSFGIAAHTATVEWYQKLSPRWTVSPLFRYYDQGAADFYAVDFSGSPDWYSSDYRVSALTAFGYGLKVIWMPTSRLQVDVAYERYDQQGNDGVTSQEVYPSANAVIIGGRVWF